MRGGGKGGVPRPGAPASGGPDTGGGMSSREEERWGLARAAALRDAGPGGARRGNNALTALFLQALAEVADGEGRPNRVSNLQRAAQGVLASPRELVDQEGLLQIHQLGLATAREIERGLWRACGPPAAAGAPAGPGPSSQRTASSLDGRRASLQQVHDSLGAIFASQERGGGAGGGGGPGGGGRGAAKPKKPYKPKYGTANFTFLVALHQLHCEGVDITTKEALLTKAEATELSSKPLRADRTGRSASRGRGRGRGGGPANASSSYDGWSNFKRLTQGDPPLVHSWSSPMKIRLTPEGLALATELHQEAHVRGACGCAAFGKAPSINLTPKRPPPGGEGGHGAGRAAPDGGRASSKKSRLLDELDAVPTRPAPAVGRPWAGAGARVSPDPAGPRRPAPSVDDRRHAQQLSEKLQDHLHVAESRWPPLGPGQRFFDRYDLVLAINQREQIYRNRQGSGLDNFIARLETAGIEVEKCQLQIGDALWLAKPKARHGLAGPLFDIGNCYVLDYILERKATEDLVASVKDKRYDKQKHYLAKSGIQNVFYLVEGDLELGEGQWEKMCKGASYATDVIDRFRVIYTENASDTCRMYAQLTRSLAKMLRSATPPQPAGGTKLKRFSQFSAELEALQRVTVSDVFVQQLMQCEGVGEKTALTIVDKFPTPMHLWNACGTNIVGSRRAAAIALLSPLKLLGNVVVNQRTVGKACAGRVWDLFE